MMGADRNVPNTMVAAICIESINITIHHRQELTMDSDMPYWEAYINTVGAVGKVQ